jgi:RHS repeat-associated protein
MSVIAQYAPDGSRTHWYTQSLARIDEVLSVVNGQGKFWYQTDALGSTYALANGAGQVVARGGYDVFGDAVAVSGNVAQPFGFTGREHERDSELVYARDRYLAASTGRWTQADRLGIAAGPNAYGYVGSNPTLLTDPSGRLPFLVVAAFGAAIGGLWSLAGGLIMGLPPLKLLEEFALGAAAGAASAFNIFPFLGVIWGSAVTNAVIAIAANLGATFVAKGSLSWDDLSSALISGFIGGLTTLLLGSARFGLRGVTRDLMRDTGMPFDVHDVFTLVQNFGAGQLDFMLQALIMPAFIQAQRHAQIEAILRDDPLAC